MSRHRCHRKFGGVQKELNNHSSAMQLPQASLSALILWSAQNLLCGSASGPKELLLFLD